MQSLKPLSEQRIVIVGASSGIGRATALLAARGGARVVLAARDAEALHSLEAEIREAGGEALVVRTDVTNQAEVEALAQTAADAFGGIDTWVADAGVSAYGRFTDIPMDEFRRVVEVDLFGVVYSARAALPHLEREGSGAFIAIGSVLSDRSVPQQSPYCAAKHAVKGFTESLRVELQEAGSGVQITLIKPSSIDTPFFDHASTHMGVKPRPVPPVYDPNLVAKAICYAATHRTRGITVGGGGKVLNSLEAFAGPVLDWTLARGGSRSQQTDQPKDADAPNNLYGPLDGHGYVRGGHNGRSVSLYTWARLHPRATVAALAGLMGGAVTLQRSRAASGRH